MDRFSDLAEELAEKLDAPHRNGGNPGYPARGMLRLYFLKFKLTERYANRFLNRVDNDPRLLELCGLDQAPSERAFSDFKNHKLAPHQDEFYGIMAAVMEDIADEIDEGRESKALPADAPPLGKILAADATDIQAYAKSRGEHCNPPGEGNCKRRHRTHCDSADPEQCTKHGLSADPDARSGYRTPKSKSPEEKFFGYDADVIADAYYGLPLYVKVRPANSNEGTVFREDLDACLELHPQINPKYLAADKGYHAGYNFRHLAGRGIAPIIAIPKPV